MAYSERALTGLIPTVYTALDVVSRELVGMIPSVQRDSTADRAAKDQTITSPVVGALSASDITPSMAVADPTADAIGKVDLTISNSKRVIIPWSGEETARVGSSYQRIMQDQMAQAFRTLTNAVESDLAGLHIYASRAYGATNAQPFASDFGDAAQIRKILDDNGAPLSERSLVLSTAAGARFRTLSKANERGTDTMERQGVLLDVAGMMVRESAQIRQAVTVGTNNGSATTDTAGYAVGSRTITLASAGTGTIIAGDIITFANDPNKYVVETGDSNVANGGTIVLAAPGLRKALPASAVVITTVSAVDRSMAFSRNAILLATRLPPLPAVGDNAVDRTVVTDPRSGLSFDMAVRLGDHMAQIEVGLSWGVKMIKPEHCALLIGA